MFFSKIALTFKIINKDQKKKDIDLRRKQNRENKQNSNTPFAVATPKGEDFTYDYEDIGQFYLEGFGKKHTLNNDQLRMLGKKIVDQLYKGDIGKAYDAIVKRGVMKEEDDEPKAKDLKGEPLSKIGYKLADTQKEMKRVVKKYSAAEGDEKEKLKDRLRELTKIKKELESLL